MKTAGKLLMIVMAIFLMTSCASGQKQRKFKFTILGRLDVNGPIYQKGKKLHADYVFESDYQLESIEDPKRELAIETSRPRTTVWRDCLLSIWID